MPEDELNEDVRNMKTLAENCLTKLQCDFGLSYLIRYIFFISSQLHQFNYTFNYIVLC